MRERLRQLWCHLRTEHTAPSRLGLAVAVGVFVGLSPFYGLHWALALGLASVLRLNRLTVLLASNISIPPLAPGIVVCNIMVGDLIRFGRLQPVPLIEAQGLLHGLSLLGTELPGRFVSCLVGGMINGAWLGGLSGAAVWWWARRRRVYQ